MDVIHALQSVASPALDRVFLWVTNLGSEQTYIVLLVVTYIAIDARAGRKIAIAFLAGFHLNQILKGTFTTARPFELDPAVARSPEAVATALGAGFPSGHAQAATTFWGLAAAYAKRRWFALVASLVIAAVALSRLYLGVHLPVDVIGGILIGMLVVLLAIAASRLASRAVVRRRLESGRVWLIAFGIAIPLALHLLLPTPESALFMGAGAAFVTGPELVRHQTRGPWFGRAALALIGVAVVFGVLAGTSAAIPDDLRHSAVGSFFRYLVVGYAGTVLMPLLGRVMLPSPVRA
ncbi:MAG: phosphatase PAP2 family protein [Trueperaceae bacterium]